MTIPKINRHTAASHAQYNEQKKDKSTLLAQGLKQFPNIESVVKNIRNPDTPINPLFLSKHKYFFGPVAPKSAQKLLAGAFIQEYAQIAFKDDGKFDFDFFKNFLKNKYPDILDVLKKSYFENIILKDNTVFLAAEGSEYHTSFQIEKINASSQIKLLKTFLTKEALSFFKHLLDIPVVQTVSQHKHHVLGDGDGSTARMVLLGIQSGCILMGRPEIENLAFVLNEEVKCFGSLDKQKDSKELIGNFKKFQSNQDVSTKLREIVDRAIYQKGIFIPIFIGDLIHDRLSCNKTATILLIEQLKKQGSVFILGNHDSFLDTFGSSSSRNSTPFSEKQKVFIPGTFEMGSSAIDQGFTGKTEEEVEKKWLEFEKTYFVNCHLSEKFFFIHNGLKGEAGNKFYSAFNCKENGDPPLEGSSLEQLVQAINELTYNSEIPGYFTSFRPKADEVTLGSLFEGITLVHGHDAFFNPDQCIGKDPIFNINARAQLSTEEAIFLPVAIAL